MVFLSILSPIPWCACHATLLSVEGHISPDLFAAIKTKSSNNKLHTFELEGDSIFTCFPTLDLWAFLQGMKKLKRFSIHHVDRDTNPENITAILSYLPSTIERIDISSQGFRNGTIPVTALTGYPHLTYLDAQDCGILEIDDALQSICSTLTKLRVLYFGDRRGSSITDLVLTGESPLKAIPDSGLQELQLYGCLETTDQGLVKAVQFLELRVLEIDRVIPDPVLLEIVKNNPSLESVSRIGAGLPPHSVKDVGLIFRNLLAVNLRLTKLKSLYNGLGLPCCLPGTVNCEVSYRPSYGVPSRLSDKSIMRRALNTVKIATYPQEDTCPIVCYSCNLSEQ